VVKLLLEKGTEKPYIITLIARVLRELMFIYYRILPRSISSIF